MSTQEYRRLPHLNYSALKTFADSRHDFYKEFVLRTVTPDKKSEAMIMGDLVHCLMLIHDEFENRYAIVDSSISVPTGQLKTLVDNLWKITLQNIGEDNQLTRAMNELLEEAFTMTCYKGTERVAYKGKTLDYAINDFVTNGREYYQYMRANFGKDVISARTYEKASIIVDELKVNPVTRGIFGISESREVTIYNEEAITFTYRGKVMKAMIDRIIVNHENKKVYIYDLKGTGWDIGSFEYNILKNHYYIQWTVYYLAVLSWIEQRGLTGYEVVPLAFIAISTDTDENPLIYSTSMEDLQAGLQGFISKNDKYYRGVDQLIDEIKWHEEHGIWNISREDYLNNGVRKVQLYRQY
jgi:hypothetical protein